MPKKRQTAVPGTIFGIPQPEGQIVLGQVLDEYYPKVPAIAVFDLAFRLTSRLLRSGEGPSDAILRSTSASSSSGASQRFALAGQSQFRPNSCWPCRTTLSH
jgi:hypothetical protein